MPNILTLTVEEPDKILNAGAYGAGAVIRLQSSATVDGVYADVAGTGSTPTVAIVAGTRSYDGYDPAGTASTWYRTRFENVGASRVSDWTDPFQVAEEGSGLICSLWDVKQALGQTDPSTDDESIVEAIRQVTDEILGYTGRLFVRTPSSGTETWVEDVGGSGGLLVTDGGRTLWYPKGLAAVTTVEVATSSQPESGGTYDTVPAAEWFLRPAVASRDHGWPATRITISDLSGSQFWDGYNTLRLTGARGWERVPYEIQGVGIRGSVAAYMTKGSEAGGAVGVGPSGNTFVLRHISPADRAKLDRYAVVKV